MLFCQAIRVKREAWEGIIHCRIPRELISYHHTRVSPTRSLAELGSGETILFVDAFLTAWKCILKGVGLA